MGVISMGGRKCSARNILGSAVLLVVAMVAVACNSPIPMGHGDNAIRETDRIFIVHSYSAEFSWTRDLHEGVIEGLAREGLVQGRDFEMQSFHMDTRITFSRPQQIQERAAVALAELQDFAPDILFVTDDIALEHVAVRYVEENPADPIPVVFGGINADPTNYSPIDNFNTPGGSITGALERIPFSDAFAIAQRLFPDASKVVVLADASTGSQTVHEEFTRDGLAGSETITVLDFLLLESFDQWQRTVTEYQDVADLIAVLNFHQLRDANGAVVPPAEVIDWMVAENDLPELGLVADWARDGVLFAVGNSGLKTGSYIGALGADILRGADPATIPIVDPQQTDTNLNLARARSLGFEFPASEVAAADVVHEHIGDP